MPSDAHTPILLVDGHVDPANGAVHRADQPPCSLSTVELALLRRLVADAGEPVSRDQLLVDVWDLDPMTLTRTVDTAVKRLRRKLEQDPRHPRHVVTVHRTGYTFRPATRSVTGWEAVQHALWSTTSPVCTLVAPAGAGKTWLVRQSLTDPIVSLDGCATEADVLVALTALGRSLSSNDPVDYLRASRADRVVLDGVDGSRQVVREVARRAAERADVPRLVITASAPLDLACETVVRLGPLDDDAARSLFLAHADCTPERIPEPVIAWAAGHPLALRIAAQWFARLGEHGMAPLLGDLGELPAPPGSPEHQRTVAAAVRATVDRLPTVRSEALRALCTFHGPFTAADAAPVMGITLGEGLVTLEALRVAGLLTDDAAKLRVTGLVRSALTPSDVDRGRHADWVTARVADVPGDPLADAAAIDALHAVLPDAINAHAWLREHRPEQAVALALALWPIAMSRTPNQVAASLFDAAPPSGLASGDHALYLARRAELQRVRGHVHQLDATLAQARQLDLSCPELDLVTAMAAHMRGDVASALQGYDALAQSIHPGVRVQARLARVYSGGGDMDRLDDIRREIADTARDAREHGLLYAHAVALSLLGRTEHAAGLLSQARTDLEAAHAFFAQYGDVRLQAQCAWSLGLLDLQVDDVAPARARFDDAVALCDAFNLAALGVFARLGRCQADLLAGDVDEALGGLQHTARFAREAGAHGVEQSVLTWLAAALFRSGQIDEARSQLAAIDDRPAARLVTDAIAGRPASRPDDPDLGLLARVVFPASTPH